MRQFRLVILKIQKITMFYETCKYRILARTLSIAGLHWISGLGDKRALIQLTNMQPIKRNEKVFVRRL